MSQEKLPSSITRLFVEHADIRKQLQAIKDRSTDDYSDWALLIKNDSDGNPHFMHYKEVEISGQRWDILAPTDRSLHVAVAQDFGVAKEHIVFRQYVNNNTPREGIHQVEEQWLYHVLDGIDVDETPRTTELERLRGILYDMMFLYTTTQDNLATSDMVIMGRFFGGQTNGGCFYRAPYLKPKFPVSFEEPVAASKFDDLAEGYYWLKEPSKANAVVWLTGTWINEKPQKIIWYFAGIRMDHRKLSQVSPEATFTPIKDHE